MSPEPESHRHDNVDHAEIYKFAHRAREWWDPNGAFATLHAINPLRLEWIDRHAGLEDRTVVDVGCGAGILSESMAVRGAQVTGLDAGAEHLEVAREHAHEAGLKIHYLHTTAEAHAEHHAGGYDIVTCLEMLEHVPDPEAVIDALVRLVRPGGWLFLSTINRTPRAFAEAIVGAEYVLNMLPAGTHEYARFIRPSELGAALRRHGFRVTAMTGLTYSPLSGQYRLVPRTDVNYLMAARREEAAGPA
ncbi:bifunctional 2-polyprenyl-6-hydroxyphenol methylase/3-demethylubiquinol 3-O-methyltransferase UbiG [Thioalkalivibrio sp. ALJT]|uniref:bifunctional 2-polyprenyl-6-hydroxyphenol methylase/3-demethylubiquinol 3-O-methyltransferase UbiG n=1 Tax=Thioalkalivibrio sp. ALJT TaxID=1158146 RepID=UPI00036B27F1|nr:bifunctional 2-polyprenyl-6-hydroxyphenol methylase/3-demethylubiquinol 3-O-methyltransferase UbiG [Thioalkalivibrio sp. ALJT]